MLRVEAFKMKILNTIFTMAHTLIVVQRGYMESRKSRISIKGPTMPLKIGIIATWLQDKLTNTQRRMSNYPGHLMFVTLE